MTDEEQTITYLSDIYNSIVIKDIVERFKINKHNYQKVVVLCLHVILFLSTPSKTHKF